MFVAKEIYRVRNSLHQVFFSLTACNSSCLPLWQQIKIANLASRMRHHFVYRLKTARTHTFVYKQHRAKYYQWESTVCQYLFPLSSQPFSDVPSPVCVCCRCTVNFLAVFDDQCQSVSQFESWLRSKIPTKSSISHRPIHSVSSVQWVRLTFELLKEIKVKLWNLMIKLIRHKFLWGSFH